MVDKWRKKLAAYEYEKKQLYKKNLSADEYEIEILKVIERLKI